MNERIKELAIQAGGVWHGGYVEQANGDSVYSEKKSVDPVDIDLNKFAELIVRECIKVMEEPDYGSEHDFVIVDTGERIKEHFGIRLQDIFRVEEWYDAAACPVCGEDGGTSCGSENCKY